MKRKSQPAQNSSGEPRRPCFPSIKEVCDRRSYLTEEEVRRVVREELEGAKSHSAEYCQSGNALEEVVQLIHSMKKGMHSMKKGMHSMKKGMLSMKEGMHSMKKSIWELKEAVELAIIDSSHVERANAKSMAKIYAKNLRLQLRTKLSLPVFTGKKLEGEGGARISVALIDANTGDAVTSGPESSIKLDVVVLEGDFKDNEDDWAQEEFENYVVKEREGRRLLIGNLLVMLKGGVGELGELIFTDNSSWNRSKMFRIGLKVASGYCGNTRIREAITDAFPVKENRGLAYKKHYPPASDDEIWRLEKIAKGGIFHQKLNEAGIYKVEDFLLQLFTDSNKLREIIGKSVTPKNWDILVDHAKTCKINWKLYVCYSDGMRKHGAVFNSDGQLIGLIKDGEYLATRRLSAQEKEHGDTIVKKAFANWNDVGELNGETFSGSKQDKSSSSFPSQVFEGQIENLTPFQRSLVPGVCAAPVGPEAPPVDGGSTAEVLSPGHNGLTALELAIRLKNINSGNAMKLLADESVRLAAQQSISTDPLNVLITRGDNGIPTVRLPIQSHDINTQHAMCNHTIHSSSQMNYTVNENVPPSEPPSAAISSFQSRSALPPEGNHVMEDF